MHGWFSSEHVGDLSEGAIPNITGNFGSSIYIPAYNTSNPSMYGNGAFSTRNRGSSSNEYGHVASSQGHNRPAYDYYMSATRSSMVYKDTVSYVEPRHIIMRYIIKYI